MNILDTIIARKFQEVAEAKLTVPEAELLQQEGFKRTPLSLKQFLLDENKTGIIAEFKRRSPSKGIINGTADVVAVTKAYARYGASGISVLTDKDFFGGTAEDLKQARVNEVPLLRKEFIVDEYQVTEARAMGADVILLIAACLTPERVEELARYAQSLQLEVLLELHTEDELAHICDAISLVGINNRDLKTFTVDINRSLELGKKIPADKVKIAESGIDHIDTICTFKNAGFKGFLIGENFMKQPDPTIAFADFVTRLKQQTT